MTPNDGKGMIVGPEVDRPAMVDCVQPGPEEVQEEIFKLLENRGYEGVPGTFTGTGGGKKLEFDPAISQESEIVIITPDGSATAFAPKAKSDE